MDSTWQPDFCNAEILRKVAEEMGIPIAMAQYIVSHYANYAADVIRAGKFEGIHFPYIGKMQPRHDKVQWMGFVRGLPTIQVREGEKKIQAQRGMILPPGQFGPIDLNQQDQDDETI